MSVQFLLPSLVMLRCAKVQNSSWLSKVTDQIWRERARSHCHTLHIWSTPVPWVQCFWDMSFQPIPMNNLSSTGTVNPLPLDRLRCSVWAVCSGCLYTAGTAEHSSRPLCMPDVQKSQPNVKLRFYWIKVFPWESWLCDRKGGEVLLMAVPWRGWSLVHLFCKPEAQIKKSKTAIVGVW